MAENKENKPYGINVSIVPGKYAPASMNVGITEEFAENLTKTVSELASKIALESYANLLKDGVNMKEARQLIEISKSTKHPLDAMADMYFPMDGKLEVETFINLEMPEEDEDFVLNFHRQVIGWPYKSKNVKSLCNFYGADVTTDTKEYFMTREDTNQIMKLITDFSKKYNFVSELAHLHVIPEYAGWVNEFHYRCFYYISGNLNETEYRPMSEFIDKLNKLIKSLEKIDSTITPEIRLFEKWEDAFTYDIVISFYVNAIPFLEDKSDEYIWENFKHKIIWWQKQEKMMKEKQITEESENDEETD